MNIMKQVNSTKNLRDFDSLFELLDHFNTETKCIDYLAKLRWNNEVGCPYCSHDNCYVLNVKNRPKRWKCAKCRKQFSVTVGTIFEESKISLKKWFVAIYLNSAHKKGISSYQLSRDIKVSQKSSWFMLQRIREIYKPDDNPFNSNEIELDDSWVGGKERNKHRLKRTPNTQGRSAKTKTPVLGIIERNGKVYAIPVTDTKARTLMPIIKKKVNPGSKVFSDEWVSYRALGKDYDHQIVNHSANEYVRGEVHTNNIESFWACLKRSLVGCYHHASDKHLERYVNEATFRFNNRKMTDGSRFDVALSNTNGRLDYKSLISNGD